MKYALLGDLSERELYCRKGLCKLRGYTVLESMTMWSGSPFIVYKGISVLILTFTFSGNSVVDQPFLPVHQSLVLVLLWQFSEQIRGVHHSNGTCGVLLLVFITLKDCSQTHTRSAKNISILRASFWIFVDFVGLNKV